jgi:hypothetical protein
MVGREQLPAMEASLAIEETPLTLARLWREMSPAQKTAAAEAFWADDESVPQQVEAVGHLARQLHFRAPSVLAMPAERKVKQLALQGRLPDNVIGRLLIVYHLTTQRPMLTAFLDALGIAHEDGLIGDSIEKPTAEQLAAAVAQLRASFPDADVRLYLKTLAVQDPETWDTLVPLAQQA